MTEFSFDVYLDLIIPALVGQIKIAQASEANQESVEVVYNLYLHLSNLKKDISDFDPAKNHIQQFTNEIQQAVNLFAFPDQPNGAFINETNKIEVRAKIEAQTTPLRKQLELMKFNFNFYKSLGFFKANIVAIGGNGSGKTSLSNKLKSYLQKNGVVVSAQRLLTIPTFSSISNMNIASSKLTQSQNADKTNKSTFSTEEAGGAYSILQLMGTEFKALLESLLSEKNALVHAYYNAISRGEENINHPLPMLDKAFSIWNSLILHRSMECEDGINITLKDSEGKSYPAHLMSDGEKVILFMIAQVLLAPNDGFIVIDEPEIYLHKTILKKLWDSLEKQRQDCIFIYLTHDLDFAVSRTTATKVWIRSFTPPETWNIEKIPDNSLPEALLLELLGSSKNILFCEGQKGSIDETIYNIIFPQFTIIPIDSCLEVINHTKAFNQLTNITTRAFGLIDSDHHGFTRLNSLKNEYIFSFAMAEVENLLLDEDFLEMLSQTILGEISAVEAIKKDIIDKLKNDVELQTSNYVSAKINLYFKDSHVSKGNTLDDINKNLSTFNQNIKIQEWHADRKHQLESYIAQSDYTNIISLYNNKGLKTFANKHFHISNFTDRAIKLLQTQPSSHEHLKKHFPSELTSSCPTPPAP